MKLLKLDNDEFSAAITSVETIIQIGSKKFMLFEVEEVNHTGRSPIWKRKPCCWTR